MASNPLKLEFVGADGFFAVFRHYLEIVSSTRHLSPLHEYGEINVGPKAIIASV